MLHLSLDEAATFERTIDAKAGQEMVFTLLSSPAHATRGMCIVNKSISPIDHSANVGLQYELDNGRPELADRTEHCFIDEALRNSSSHCPGARSFLRIPSWWRQDRANGGRGRRRLHDHMSDSAHLCDSRRLPIGPTGILACLIASGLP